MNQFDKCWPSQYRFKKL